MENVGDPSEGCRDVFAVGNTALHDRQAIGFRQDAMVAEGADPGVREVRAGEDAINKGAADFAGRSGNENVHGMDWPRPCQVTPPGEG